jgi:hypothetical protein
MLVATWSRATRWEQTDFMNSEHEEIVKLAKGFLQELKAGSVGAEGEKARRYIEANPDAALEIITLLHKEANRKKPNELKIQAYLYMFGHALALIRYQLERPSRWLTRFGDCSFFWPTVM